MVGIGTLPGSHDQTGIQRCENVKAKYNNNAFDWHAKCAAECVDEGNWVDFVGQTDSLGIGLKT
jgi:hypothetical protein